MFPHQGSSMNRGSHLTPSMPSNTVHSPGISASALVSSGGPSVSFSSHQGFGGTMSVVPSSINFPPNQSKAWPQASPQHFQQQEVPNQQLLEQSQLQKDNKHRDYLKQQQRLKAMPLSSSKGMSADALIGNLLEKKDTFTPKPSSQGHGKQIADHKDMIRQHVQPVVGIATLGAQSSNDVLPGWLLPNSPRLPAIYTHIWSLVNDHTSGGTLVDTNKILALLLTSKLPKEVLGFIWNLATNGVNGQLNQQQLYITLALVALAQMGCTFNNLSVLSFIPSPPIPTFNMSVPKSGFDDQMKHTEMAMKSQATSCPTLPPPSTSDISPLTISTIAFSSHQSEEDDFADDFTDFQSAVTPCLPPSHVSNMSMSIPATAVIQPSTMAKQVVNELNHSVVTKLGRSQGRSIGSRLANHNLGAPKLSLHQKQRRASVESDNMYIQDDLSVGFEKTKSHFNDEKTRSDFNDPNINSKHHSVCENEDFSDFQIGAGLNVNVDELFPKCHPKPKHHDLMLKESAIRFESCEEDMIKEREEQLLAFDSPKSLKEPVVEQKSTLTQKDMPLVSPPPSKPTKELMSIEEDKYSALRLIELEASKSCGPEMSEDSTKCSDADDFGDFVSADDLFAEIAIRETGSSLKQVSGLSHGCQPSVLQNAEFPVGSWAPSTFLLPQPPTLNTNVSNEAKCRLNELSSAFTDLDVSKGDESVFKVDIQAKWSCDFDIGKESMGLNLDANFDIDSSQNDDDFGDFVGPDSAQVDNTTRKMSSGFLGDQLWSDNSSNKIGHGMLSDNRSVSSLELPGMTLSRHGSLPSLDLNLFPATEDISDKAVHSQFADWLRCLESSCLLLQAAASTFTNITAHSVLLEVLSAAEGQNYLNNLLEVHRVCWRIQRSYQRSGHDSNQMDSILTSITKVWSTLQTFYKLANIETAVEKDGSDEESGQPACGVCGSPASRGVLEYAGHVYHAPCANLWLNCVDRILPAHSPLL